MGILIPACIIGACLGLAFQGMTDRTASEASPSLPPALEDLRAEPVEAVPPSPISASGATEKPTDALRAVVSEPARSGGAPAAPQDMAGQSPEPPTVEAVAPSPISASAATEESTDAPRAVVSEPARGGGVPASPQDMAGQSPGPPTVETAPPPAMRIFGTVEFRGSLKNMSEWLNMLGRNQEHPVLAAGRRLNKQTTWDELNAAVRGKSPLETIRVVNVFWNQWPYRLDREVYGKEDYWAAPYEFLKYSGDCEDYGITKYFTLKAMGFNPDAMRIVVVRDIVRNLAHAVLAVSLNDEIYILDNLSNAVLPHTRFKNYVPQYSVNERHRWAHLRPKKTIP